MKRPPGIEALTFQREMRRNMTEPEKRLWHVVRNRQISNAKFRKQSWLGPFLVDFFCAEAKLSSRSMATATRISRVMMRVAPHGSRPRGSG